MLGTRVEFIVDGFRPPRKRIEKSLWAHPKEAPLVFIMRKAALKACVDAGIMRFDSKIKLELHLYTPNVEGVGDLDSFIAGVCDGLQPADQNVETFDPCLADAAEINPKMAILIANDSNVVRIVATKEWREMLGYRVAIEEA